MNIILPDGKALSLPEGSKAIDVASAISPKLQKAALAARVNDQLCDLNSTINDNDTVAILTFDSPDGKSVFWHSSAHILAKAVQSLYPEAKVAIGPSIENGFYYDFDIEKPFTPEDISLIESKVKEILSLKENFVREEPSKEFIESHFKSNNEIYKLELLNDITGAPSIYKTGSWLDLCRGPHIPDTSYIKAFKIISFAGAYWRGNEKNRMLQRIYGISFPKQSMLDEYVRILEEAQKRDHRKLGKDLDLFSVSDSVGPGLVLWHPLGGRLRTTIEDFWRQKHQKNGYEIVYTPHIGRANLWETSGHLDFYRDNMYAPMEIDEQEYFVKPMNCPFHIMIYKNSNRSYRELPLRWAELGTVYRYEKSGVLHGLLRVRGFTQDDAHLICRPDQMPQEIRSVLRFCLYMLNSFGFENFKVYLATRPKEKSVGAESEWNAATVALKEAVQAEGLECEIDEGGGAFYGPKIDIKIKDALNREWQCSTIQFDFNLPERFDMTYVGANNERQRPVVIHRALLGSIERFMGVLIEHYAGAFPVWLAPIQLKILPISDKYLDYSYEVKNAATLAGIRVDLDDRNEKIGYKIREAEVKKVPFMVIVGEKEQEEKTVSVRQHGKGDTGSLALDAFIGMLVNLSDPGARDTNNK